MQFMQLDSFSFLSVTCYLFLEDNKRETLPPLKDIRERCIAQLEQMRPDHMRRLNPTPYKVIIHLDLALYYLRFGMILTVFASYAG